MDFGEFSSSGQGAGTFAKDNKPKALCEFCAGRYLEVSYQLQNVSPTKYVQYVVWANTPVIIIIIEVLR